MLKKLTKMEAASTTKVSIVIKPETKKVETIDEPHLESFKKEIDGEKLSITTHICLSGNSYSPEFCEKMGVYLSKMEKLEVSRRFFVFLWLTKLLLNVRRA